MSKATRPWHRRSPLWDLEPQIRQLISEGWSDAQIVERLELKVSRQRLTAFIAAAGITRSARRSQPAKAKARRPPSPGPGPEAQAAGRPPSADPAPATPAPEAGQTADFKALFQSQFKRPLK